MPIDWLSDEETIELAVNVLVSMVPKEFHDTLGANGYYDIDTIDGMFAWHRATVEKIVARVSTEEWGQRAPCPLCGTVPYIVYPREDGFTVPEGLTRHLSGSYNAHICGVFGVLLNSIRRRVLRAQKEKR